MDEVKGLTVIMPCYNEAGSLRSFLPEILNIAGPMGWRVIAVDDGSTDESAIILESMSANYPELSVMRHNTNKGYGAALKTGIQNTVTEFAVTIDADGQHFPEDIPRLAEKQKQTDADLVIGSRADHGAGGRYRSAGKWAIRKVAHILTETQVSDLNSGMKLFRTVKAKELIRLCPDSMAFSDVLTLSFVAERNLVVEEPIRIRPRSSGVSTIGIGTAFDTLHEILNIVMLFNPIRIFLPIAILMFMLGLLWGIPIMIAGRGVSVGAALLMLTGVMVFLLGLIAEQLSKLRKGDANSAVSPGNISLRMNEGAENTKADP
ncbi:MAG: glycosyltransferase family 2 protein [Ignavibacteria bacterium]|nr:glycosyltransferase family 2 protein [Ignavibacteria bacterium]